MPLRLSPARRGSIAVALGTAQTISWASSYYIPAVLARPMGESFGLSPVWIFGAFSMALVVSALVGPWAGGVIDRIGGRNVLVASNLIFAAGLVLLAVAPTTSVLFAGWAIMGLGMGIGLYEAAFATLARLFGQDARGPITGVTLIAGFASTVGWPLSGLMLTTWGWREACIGWAAIQLCLALPLNAMLPAAIGRLAPAPTKAPEADAPWYAVALLACVFAATSFNSTAIAAHLPNLLEAAGASTAMAIAAGAFIGPAQVAARILEFGGLRRFHPIVSTRLAASAHPIAAACLIAFGAPVSFAFAVLHGAGNGILTICRGTLPLALFGTAGYGARLGWLNAPARALQAGAPVAFGAAVTSWGLQALWITASIGLCATLALCFIRRN